MHTFGGGVGGFTIKQIKNIYIYIYLFLNEEENVTYFITSPQKSVLMLIYILFVLNILY